MTGKYIPTPHPVIKENDSYITNPKEIANIFANHYYKISEGTTTNTPKNPITLQTTKAAEPEYNKSFTMEELNMAISNMNDSSPGPDNIHNKMIKNLPPNLRDHLLKNLNWFWKCGSLPKQWKQAIIIPILKPGKETNIPLSYRPISLTNTLSKLYE